MSGRRERRVAVVAGVVAALLAWFTLRHGIALGPDAWTYWCASISLLEGHGYVDGHGAPVLSWPPGYPIWLAAVQSVVGVSANGLRVADSLTVGAIAGLATAWGLLRTRGGGGPAWPVAVAAVCGAVAAARGCGSEFPMLTLLFGALVVLEGGAMVWWRWAAATALLAAMVLTRHAALAFVPALWFVVPATPGGRRFAPFAAMVVVVVGAWAAVRAWLGQGGTFPLFSGDQPLGFLLSTMTNAIDRGIAPFPIGIALFVGACWAFQPGRARVARWLDVPVAVLGQGRVMWFVLASLAGLLAMFLLVYIADPPRSRFVRFASLIVSILLVGVVRHAPRPRLQAALLALLLLPTAVYCGKHALLGRVGHSSMTANGGESFVPLDAVPGPAEEPEQRRPDGRLQVPTPRFEWQEPAAGDDDSKD